MPKNSSSHRPSYVKTALAVFCILLLVATTTGRVDAQGKEPAVVVDLSKDGFVIFGPVPPKPANRADWATPDGSADYMALFEPGADWATAAARVDGFKIHSWMIRHYLTDAELITIGNRLDELGIALVIEAEPLNPPDPRRCDHGESFEGPYEIENLQRLQSLGVDVHVISVEQPFSYGHLLQGPRACQYTIEQVVDEVHAWVNQARAIYPDVQVGSIEGLSPTFNTTSDDIARWLDAYQSRTGEALAFIHLDVDWRWDGWEERALEIEKAADKRGIPFSLLYNGDFTRSSGADWLQTAAEHFATFEVDYGGTPNHVNLQSWVELPDFVLPESDPAAFTSLINRYFGTRTVLTEPALVYPAPNERLSLGTADITGSLTTLKGGPVGGADIEVTLSPLSAVRQQHVTISTVPSLAVQATVLVRVHVEGGVPGNADIRLYDTSYVEAGRANLVPNHDFARGLDDWGVYAVAGAVGTAEVLPSDSGPGTTMVRLTATPSQEIYFDGTRFDVTAGADFEFSADFALAAEAYGTGNISVAFIDIDGNEIRRDAINFESAPSLELHGTTGKDGNYSIRMPKIYPGSYDLTVRAPGDLNTWPAQLTTEQDL